MLNKDSLTERIKCYEEKEWGECLRENTGARTDCFGLSGQRRFSENMICPLILEDPKKSALGTVWGGAGQMEACVGPWRWERVCKVGIERSLGRGGTRR